MPYSEENIAVLILKRKQSDKRIHLSGGQSTRWKITINDRAKGAVRSGSPSPVCKPRRPATVCLAFYWTSVRSVICAETFLYNLKRNSSSKLSQSQSIIIPSGLSFVRLEINKAIDSMENLPFLTSTAAPGRFPHLTVICTTAIPLFSFYPPSLVLPLRPQFSKTARRTKPTVYLKIKSICAPRIQNSSLVWTETATRILIQYCPFYHIF